MHKQELTATLALAAIYAFRLLGLFMILPVFSLYAQQYHGVTPTLLGLAIGIYGLTQSVLQIPFGTLSDYYGRRPIMALGLVCFILGSVIAALSTSILGVIIGRAIQGAGAIGSATMAAVADATAPENRTKAMAIIGVTIGFSFTLAMALGPIIAEHYNLQGIFWLTALLGVAGLLLLATPLHADKRRAKSMQNASALLKSLANKELMFLNFSIFNLHALLTAFFIVTPIILNSITPSQWRIYVPILFGSALLMFALIDRNDSCQRQFITLRKAIFALGIFIAAFWLHHQTYSATFISLLGFFTAFNILEAYLPALISKLAPAEAKGTALGIFSTMQFLGIFVGGAIGGYLYGQFSLSGVFWLCITLIVIWFTISLFIRHHGDNHG